MAATSPFQECPVVLQETGACGAGAVCARTNVNVVVELDAGKIEIAHQSIQNPIKVRTGCRMPQIQLVPAPIPGRTGLSC